MNANDLKREIFNLETELEMLKALGVFRLVPQREERSDRKGEWLAFKRRGMMIVDESVPYIRCLSLPLERNKNKANMLLRKMERTKKAEALIRKIKNLKAKLKEEQSKAAKVAEFRRKELEFAMKATEYAAKANAYRERADYYAKEAAALQPA